MKLNGSIKLIGFIVLIVGATASVVVSVEGMRGDMRVNTAAIEANTKETGLMREDMIRLQDRVNAHIEKDN